MSSAHHPSTGSGIATGTAVNHSIQAKAGLYSYRNDIDEYCLGSFVDFADPQHIGGDTARTLERANVTVGSTGTDRTVSPFTYTRFDIKEWAQGKQHYPLAETCRAFSDDRAQLSKLSEGAGTDNTGMTDPSFLKAVGSAIDNARSTAIYYLVDGLKAELRLKMKNESEQSESVPKHVEAYGKMLSTWIMADCMLGERSLHLAEGDKRVELEGLDSLVDLVMKGSEIDREQFRNACQAQGMNPQRIAVGMFTASAASH